MEIRVELAQDALPLDPAGLDLVELVLHVRREFHVDNILEMVEHQIGHDDAERGRRKAFVLFNDIFPILDRRNDGRIG